jgi:hypothetical protein
MVCEHSGFGGWAMQMLCININCDYSPLILYFQVIIGRRFINVLTAN